MHKKLKAFIFALVWAIVLFAISFIVFFVVETWYGVIPLGFGLFFLFGYAIPALKQYQEEMADINLHKRTESTAHEDDRLTERPLGQSKQISHDQALALTRELLIAHYLEMAEEVAKDFDLEERLPDVKDSIKNKIRALLAEQERIHGRIYLTENTETNQKAKEINSYIGKHCFAITIYYLFELKDMFPLYSYDDIIESLIRVHDYLHENADVDDSIMNYLHLVEKELESNKNESTNKSKETAYEITVQRIADNITSYNYSESVIGKSIYTKADFCIYVAFTLYVQFCQIIHSEEPAKKFSSTIYNLFIEHFIQKSNDRAFWEQFLDLRLTAYDKIMINLAKEKRDVELSHQVRQFILADICEDFFPKKIIIQNILDDIQYAQEITSNFIAVSDIVAPDFKKLLAIAKET